MAYFYDFLDKTDDRLLTKWMHYLDVYQRELGHLEGRDVTFLEIGIYKGGSIPMWKGFFGEGSRLVFADIDPACKTLADPGTNIEIGDQSDPKFLAMLGEKYGPFDLILDDGGHHMHQQITSFEHLWPHLKDHARYFVEDTHTSYWPGFGGGYKEDKSFIEYAKRLIDTMHSWYTDQDEIFPFDEMAREIRAVRFYDSIVVVEKGSQDPPPQVVISRNGQVSRSRKILEMRNRKSIFQGSDRT